MLSRTQTEELLRGIYETIDMVDPVRWKTIVTNAIHSQNDPWRTGNVPKESFDATRQERFWLQYLTWKRFVSKCALKSGHAFKRSFWRDLLDPVNRQAVALADPIALLGEDLLVNISLALATDEPFSNSCATTLMHETVQEALTVPTTKAEDLNDAGFGQQHPGGYADAVSLHEQAIACSPQFSLARINKGIGLKNLGRFDEAIACYDHVIQNIDTDYKKAWHNKGVALMHLGRDRDALLCFDRALQIDPHYAVAARVREQFAMRVSPATDAAAANKSVVGYAEQLVQHPQASQLWKMAQSLQQRGNLDAAERLANQALTLLPDHPLLMSWRADFLFHLGRIDEAERILELAIKVAPTIGQFWTDVCRCRLERKNFQGALQAAEEAVRLAPEDSMGWANRAASLSGLNQLKEGRDSARHATELDPRNEWAWLHLGQTNWRLGRRDEAELAFKQLLSVCPNFREGDRVRKMIQMVRNGD